MAQIDKAGAPQITLIVMVREADPVEALIASLTAQSHTDFEVLLVQEATGDATAGVIADDPRFHRLRPQARGLAAARNAGLDRARGRFVAFLDGTDALAPDFLHRLLKALETQGTDWAACGVAQITAEGRRRQHPPVAGRAEGDLPARLPLQDARRALQVLPGFGNKLCRRSLFDGLRFAEDLTGSDDEVFWTLVARAPVLALVPEPLCRQAAPARETGDERIFDTLRLLDRLHPLIRALDHGAEAFARLATLRVHEGALNLRAPERRARFLTATWALFDRLGVVWTPGEDPDISRGLGLALAGELPLSVVVLGENPGPALTALAGQDMADFEVLLLGPPGPSPGPGALATGKPVRRLDPGGLTGPMLAQALGGRWVLLLAPGEVPLPKALMTLLNLAEDSVAPLILGGLQRPGGGSLSGWIDWASPVEGALVPLDPEAALSLYPALGNRLLRRDLLALIRSDIAGDAVLVQALVLVSALSAGQAAATPRALVRLPETPQRLPGLFATRRAVQGLTLADTALPKGWRGRVFLRLVRLSGGQGALRWALAAVLALSAGWLPASPAARPDAATPRWLRWLAGDRG